MIRTIRPSAFAYRHSSALYASRRFSATDAKVQAMRERLFRLKALADRPGTPAEGASARELEKTLAAKIQALGHEPYIGYKLPNADKKEAQQSYYENVTPESEDDKKARELLDKFFTIFEADANAQIRMKLALAACFCALSLVAYKDSFEEAADIFAQTAKDEVFVASLPLVMATGAALSAITSFAIAPSFILLQYLERRPVLPCIMALGSILFPVAVNKFFDELRFDQQPGEKPLAFPKNLTAIAAFAYTRSVPLTLTTVATVSIFARAIRQLDKEKTSD